MCLENAETHAPSQALGYVVEQRLQARQADDCLRVTYVSEAVRGKETHGDDMAYVSEAVREERETWRE